MSRVSTHGHLNITSVFGCMGAYLGSKFYAFIEVATVAP